MKKILMVLLSLCMTLQCLMLNPYSYVYAQSTNVALNKEVTASGVEVEGSWGPEKAFDGDKTSADSRWSSPRMKPNGATESSQQTPQWLVVDLAATKSNVESIEIVYHLKVWSTKYKIQTSDTGKDGSWEDVYSIERASSSNNAVTDTITADDMTQASLKRYVRFYFEKLNVNAAGIGVSVKEITIMASQEGIVEKEMSAKEALATITSLPVKMNDETLNITSPAENIEISVHGSEVGQVLSDNGEISPYHIGTRSFNVILKAVNKNNPTDTATKNITVSVPGNESLYRDIFKTVSHPNEKPDVLPAIQEWYGLEGYMVFTEDSKIIINDKAQVGLNKAALEMQSDLKEIIGMTLEIVEGDKPVANSVYIESQKEDIYGTGKEGYFIINDNKGIEIYSSTYTGALYGTVTIEQILTLDEDHNSVPKGIIRDYPLLEVRGVMFDVARIPTRYQFLEDYTKIFKWYKLNELQLHLNDNQWSDPAYSSKYEDWKITEASHRLWSDLFPSLATQESKFELPGDNEGRYDYYFNEHTGLNGELYYTKEQYRELQDLAGIRGFNLVAELDTPSHSAAYAKYVYENQEEVITSLVEHGYLDKEDYLDNNGNLKDGVSFYIHNPSNMELLSIDDNSSNAVEKQNAINAKIFMKALLDEYLGGDDPLFKAPMFHAGVDEYWDKSKKEAFREYMNFMEEIVHDEYGKEVRMWGSLKQFTGTTPVSKDIVLEVWNISTEEDPIARMKEGYSVINVPQPYLYTTPGRYHKDVIREEYVYNVWEPEMFNGNTSALKGDPLFKGAKGALWGDENREGITEADLHERYLRLSAMVSEKTWGADISDQSFVDYETKFYGLQEGPGTKISYEIESLANTVVDYDMNNVSKDGKTLFDMSGNDYHAEVINGQTVTIDNQTWMKFDGDTVIKTPLKTLGYPYTLSFDVYLDETNDKSASLFKGYDGKLQISNLNDCLTLNRDYFTQSLGYKVNTKEKHTITIVGTYQTTKLYVDGEFKSILHAEASDTNVGVSTWKDSDNNFRTTFVFPLEVIGENFKGYLANIKAYNKALSVEELKSQSLINSVDVARNENAYTESHNPSFWGDQMRLYPAWKATDGNGRVAGATTKSVTDESRWNSSDHNQDFLMIDLGENQEINKVVIDWEPSRYASSYNIEVSTDKENWQIVKKVTGNTNALTTDTFDKVEARYVKMQGVNRRSGSNEYSIYEMKVYSQVDKTALNTLLNEVANKLEKKKVNFENKATQYKLYADAYAIMNDVLAKNDDVVYAMNVLNELNTELDQPALKPFPFTDVSDKQWYYGVINEAYQLGLMSGATETLFKPNANMNRGMVAIVFHRMEGSKKVEYSSIFPDVANKQYYTTSVLWAKQTGVINGYKDGTFKPLRNVTREEMATMIYNFARYKGLDMSASKDITYFSDYAKITPYARVTLQWAVEKGLMSGKLNGTKLDPLGTATRAECSKMLVQAYKVIYK